MTNMRYEFKLDFPGNLFRAIHAIFYCCFVLFCVFFMSCFVLLDGSLCVLYCIVFSVSCVGRVTNLLALFTLIYLPSLCATLSVYRIFVGACNHAQNNPYMGSVKHKRSYICSAQLVMFGQVNISLGFDCS